MMPVKIDHNGRGAVVLRESAKKHPGLWGLLNQRVRDLLSGTGSMDLPATVAPITIAWPSS